ncbi:MAG TPA: cytochrome bc complex cytochrome b subunit, partial [Nitrospiria bacterium]|nr:cytochrome bc complex cytochrome b subunit [Nitrospiria bacterium]
MPENQRDSPLEKWLRISSLSFPVPAHSHTLGYCLGGITLVGFLILFGTGFFLIQFFNPAPDKANASLHHIVENVMGGKWIRSLHYWTAQAVMLSMVAHVLRIFFGGAYKAPR